MTIQPAREIDRPRHQLERATPFSLHFIHHGLCSRTLGRGHVGDRLQDVVLPVDAASPIHLGKVEVGPCQRAIPVEGSSRARMSVYQMAGGAALLQCTCDAYMSNTTPLSTGRDVAVAIARVDVAASDVMNAGTL